ncbi:hypothetical protein ACM64Y_02845 [Novispirillum sp. DQ9]|uniref:hypothetical protein n=1 Tax=Novispirillum sp. DQ9 TaxID=3398612 RepID=UPI003C799D6C
MSPASSATRVSANTAPRINAAIEDDIRERLIAYAARLDAIEGRLRELDREWDIERAIEANAATLALSGVLLAVLHDRRWLVLPALVTAFLLQHALQGWCPPVPVLRRLGFRTPAEIARERMALKALRGDFEGVTTFEARDTRDRATEALRATH